MWETYELFVNERLGEVWTNEARGLSARKLQRTTYSLGSRGTDDLGELDRRAVLVTAGCDVHADDIRTEFVAWGIDPVSGMVITWGLMYRIIGGAPDDTIEDPDLWRAWEKVIDGSAWRHPGYEGRAIPAQRVLIDAGYRSDIVRGWCEAKYSQQVHTGRAAVGAYRARILPVKSKPQDTGGHPVDLKAGMRRPPRHQAPRFPELVSLESDQVKSSVYASVLRDRRLPEGAPQSNYWPNDKEARGYTESWYREFSSEVKMVDRSPKGKISTHFKPKAGEQGENHAWDCRIYATGAALVHVYRDSLRVGLIRLALRDAARKNSSWSADETAALDRHLVEAGGADYDISADNVVPLR